MYVHFMKLRILKAHMNKACLWYTEQLSRKQALLTPARIEELSRELVALQQYKQKVETNPIWQVPVGLHIEAERNFFEVVVTDESNVLYLDFDLP